MREHCLLFVTLMVLMAACSGCRRGPAAIEAPDFDPAASATAAMEQYDLNKDGVLDKSELAKCPSLQQALSELDANGDLRVSEEEIRARVATYVSVGVGRKQENALVTRDGAALAGAEIRLVPEAFMLDAMAPARGVTDAGGFVSLSMDEVDPPGVAPGFYRIEVSKRDAAGKETIPAKFNTATTLGVEIPTKRKKRGDSYIAITLK